MSVSSPRVHVILFQSLSLTQNQHGASLTVVVYGTMLVIYTRASYLILKISIKQTELLVPLYTEPQMVRSRLNVDELWVLAHVL